MGDRRDAADGRIGGRPATRRTVLCRAVCRAVRRAAMLRAGNLTPHETFFWPTKKCFGLKEELV